MTDARTLLRSARAVLLDFDGPVTPLMPAPLNMHAADAARAALASHGFEPKELQDVSDHLAVIRWAGEHAPEALPDVESACVSAEVEAAHTSEPTPGARELMTALYSAGVPIVVVTNNAKSAAWTFLERWSLMTHVLDVVGRPIGEPTLMKPNIFTIEIALNLIQEIDTADVVLIGDSVSDIKVAQAAGLRSLGYGKNPRRGEELAAAGADALVSAIRDLVDPPW